jgi:hypothetical protein
MRYLLSLALLACSCAALGLRQGEPLDVSRLMASHKDNAVATHTRWDGVYVQVSGTIVETGFIDKEEMKIVVTGNRYYSSGTSTQETVKYPYVILQSASDAVVKCVLEPGWGNDLTGAHRGSTLRASAHFVSVNDGPPAVVMLRECRIREIGAAVAPAAPTAAAL